MDGSTEFKYIWHARAFPELSPLPKHHLPMPRQRLPVRRPAVREGQGAAFEGEEGGGVQWGWVFNL
jgi:hypothetical protein